MTAARDLARRLGGEAVGANRILAPGPGHSARDRSLSVTIDERAPDGFVVNSFAGDDWRACRDHVREAIGGHLRTSAAPLSTRLANRNRDSERTVAYALALWNEAQPLTGTPGERYLDVRGVGDVPEAFCPDVLRFHPACPFGLEGGGKVKLPTMLAAMVDIRTNKFRCVHRTALAPDGTGKAAHPGLGSPKKMLGSAAGACVKLTADEDVTYGLHLAEGIETSLACMAMGLKPMWACLSAGGIAAFPVLSGIEALTIFADNDSSSAGERSAQACAARWRAAGRECRIFMADEVGVDFADFAGSRGR